MYDLVGKTLGKYQIIERLHQTAVTEVYKGFNPGMNRFVVVNVLKAEFTENETILQRFLEQNDIAAKIQHPNLLPMLDFGEEDGIYYRVLMYGSEGNWADNKKWFNNTQAILGLFSQLSTALSEIHTFSYVYLNLRPFNIFFDDQRKAMLGDFGIAVSPELSKTDPYCGPEVRRQEPVDHRTDIYALGVLLYNLLTGNPPDMDRYVSLGSLRPDLPQEVEKVILKALSDRLEERFQSVNTFQAALESAFRYTNSTSVAAPVPVEQQPKKSKVWLIVLVVAIIALCVASLAIGIPLLAGDSDVIVEETVEAPPPPDEEVVVVPTEPAPGEDAPDRPGWQLPDIDLPDLSEIPICNSLYPAAGLGMIGIVAMKRKKKSSAKEDEQIDHL
jgi:serine/threonine protein kinase